jgi:hypothetical protein
MSTFKSPSTPSRKILFDPLKILQNGGKSRVNLGLAGLVSGKYLLCMFGSLNCKFKLNT